ncbi:MULTISPECIES: DUF7289 family protein [Salinibaculum]|uniref:DUF7289 family protein n=1 Tax=Salinibaculum TaxID=2732368 RepID=UPI0030D163EF
MRSDERAVSEVLGYVLAFSLVITTVGVVTVAGFTELQDTRDTEQINNAERAFDLLATNMNDIAKRGAPSRSTEMRLAEAQLDISNPITIGIEVNGTTAADNFTNSYELYPITYRASNSDQTVVYSAGTIFRSQDDGANGIAIQKPSLVVQDDRFIFPIYQTRSRGTQSIGGGTARIRGTDAGTVLIVSDTSSRYSNISLNVTSPRSGLWLEMLNDYDSFDECGTVTGSSNEIYCRMEDPSRVHISLIRVDVEVSP